MQSVSCIMYELVSTGKSKMGLGRILQTLVQGDLFLRSRMSLESNIPKSIIFHLQFFLKPSGDSIPYGLCKVSGVERQFSGSILLVISIIY
jgi:hypothetical protein